MWKRWWLCHATDFHSLMYPCFICCRILGIFPYKFNDSTFKISKPQYILSTVVICVCCAINLLIIKGFINYGDMTTNLYHLTYHILSIFIVIVAHILSGPRMRLLQTILEISSKLSQESYQKLSRLIHVKNILGFIFKCGHCFLYFLKIPASEMSYSTVFIGITITYFTLITFQMTMLYINCVYVLKACFESINDTVTHMLKHVVNDKESFISHVHKNQFLLTELKIVKKKHLLVSNSVQMLNIIFSLHLLATIVITFFTTTFTLYLYVVHWQDGIYISFNSINLDLLLSTMGYNIIIILLLLWACETSKNRAQEIGTTIHDLLNSTNNEEIKYELRLFSLQKLHYKNIFSTKGLSIDATLLTAMVYNITTYLVVLIQFLDISHSCDKKSTINVELSN